VNKKKYDKNYDLIFNKEESIMNNERLKDPIHKQRQNDIDRINRLQKQVDRLWQFILEQDCDVSSIKDVFDK
jgi:hypothetical protein